GGGSLLAVPLLSYGVDLVFLSAVSISLLVVVFTAIFGLIVNYKQQDIHYIAAVVMIYTGVVFAPIGSYISQDMSDKLLMLSFSI
ncbi:sulfite exporter TauE/SafE family protein, partial [Francisella tularensis subsp. holarctica]|uniref:sulfite exporter TauE/SafE family protein n=1 Tax=Francisella tularensis TaxID=263 RepID=UPI002381B199